jgi:hypothetical protein
MSKWNTRRRGGPRAAASACTRARIERLDRIAHDVMLVALRLVGGKRIAFEAGQYVNIILPDGDRRAYSSPRPPGNRPRRAARAPHAGGKFTTLLFEHTKVGDLVRFEARSARSSCTSRARAADLRRRGDRFAPVQEPARAGLVGHHAPAPFLLGRAQAARPVSALPERWQQST